jgi:hypothetical protein
MNKPLSRSACVMCHAGDRLTRITVDFSFSHKVASALSLRNTNGTPTYLPVRLVPSQLISAQPAGDLSGSWCPRLAKKYTSRASVLPQVQHSPLLRHSLDFHAEFPFHLPAQNGLPPTLGMPHIPIYGLDDVECHQCQC